MNTNVNIEINKKFTCYKDFLYKKLKPKSELLENQLENAEQQFIRANELAGIYNLSIPTQDDVWICGRVYSDNSGGGGKLNEHNVHLQGSYLSSNSHGISLDLSNCSEYSLFPGQLILAYGRNPDGKRFICKQIVEPLYINKCKELTLKQDLTIAVASGPYMMNGSLSTDSLSNLVNTVKAKNANVLILLGPFIDANHDLLSNTDTKMTFDQHFQKLIDDLAVSLRNTNIQVIIQPSLNDITQEPIYPILPFQPSAQFLKQNNSFHFTSEPSIVNINGLSIAITSTDIIKDLTVLSTAKTTSSDKISRNFSHILRQKTFYPIYPPPDHVCIDYEAWNEHSQLGSTSPHIFIVSSDLASFNKEVNGCVCLNPGRLVRGTSTGSYAIIQVKADNKEQSDDKENTTSTSSISVTFNKL